MSDFANLLHDVEIARAGQHGKRNMPIGILEEITDVYDLERHEIPILRNDHDGARCGLVVALDLVDDLLFADLELTDDAMADIRAGTLVHVSIAHDRDPDGLQRLQHVALVRKDIPPGMNLPALQSYIDTNVDLEQESITMNRHDFGDGFKAARLCVYSHRVPQWQQSEAGQFTERPSGIGAMSPQQAGAKLARLANDYRRQHPEICRTFEQALDAVRASDEGRVLFQRWGGQTAAAQTKGYGQTQRQQSAIEQKNAAAKEVDLRVRRYMAKTGETSYTAACAAVLAGDRDLLRAYARA